MAESNDTNIVSEAIKAEIRKFAEKGTAELQNYIQKKCDEWKDTNITIGVIGECHSGKSYCINALRGLGPRDKGAALVKSCESTKEPTPYKYNNNSAVTLWDLPGVGTPLLPKDKYMEKINVSK